MTQDNEFGDRPGTGGGGTPPGGMPPGGMPPGGMPPGSVPPPMPPAGGQGPFGPPPGYGPPPGQPPQDPMQAGPYGPPPGYGMPEFPHEEPKEPNKALPWMIATGVAALLAVGGLAWGFVQKSNADSAANASAQELATVQAQLQAEKQRDEQLQQELDEVKAEYSRVKAKLKVEKGKFKSEVNKLDELSANAKRAANDAAKKNATLRTELAASQAQAQLATKCAQVMATGLQVIYDATTPQQVMKDVAKEIQRASSACDRVVSVG